MTIRLEREAQEPKQGMTLIELVAFVRQCEQNKIDPEARVKATVGMGLQLRTIRVEAREQLQ